VFVVKNGVVATPGLDSSILPGITRDSVITLARGMGLTVEVRSLTRGELMSADEAFFTGTAAEITPIREVDGYVVGAGKRGPVTERLQKAFFDCVRGRDAAHADWLTPVS
jgi:branched-chain amino acid aminotransferase